MTAAVKLLASPALAEIRRARWRLFVATASVILWLGKSDLAGAETYFELDGLNGFTNSPGAPADVLGKLQETQKTKPVELKCVAFTPGGDWVILFGTNGIGTNNSNLPAVKKLTEILLKDPRVDFKCVAFSPAGGWTILWSQNGSWTEGSIPEEAFKKFGEVGKRGGTLRSIAFAPNGGWVLLFDKEGVAYGGVREDLVKVLDDTVRRHQIVRSVAFAPNGDWICLTNSGSLASNPNLASAQSVDANFKRGASPKWLAFAPGDNEHGPYQVVSQPSQRVVATLTTDIAHPDAQVDDWILYSPEVPDLPCQQQVKTTFSPVGSVVREGSPLKRSLILTRISDKRKQVNTVMTVEATLVSRQLMPLAEGQTAPTVPDLPPNTVKIYTAASPTLDFNKMAFQDWMNRAKLKRSNGEPDMDFAHRVFSYIKHHYTYQWPTPAHTGAETCAAGKSDCGGLSAMFASAMRANGIPARLLAGRWAISQKGNEMQTHVKSEFFAQGVGWVPVDMSAGVSDTNGGEFAHFGHDGGDFIAFADDQSLLVNTIDFGPATVPILQGIAYWWRGSGADRNNRYTETWTVQKK
jgi:hypothetical protein